MKTHCPKCETLQEIPNEYANKLVKCQKCGQIFKAVISVPIIRPKHVDNPSPPAARRPFPAQFLTIILLGLLLVTGLPLAYRHGYTTGRNDGAETAQLDLFYAQTTYAARRSEYISGGNFYALAKAIGSLELAADLKTVSLSDTTSSNIRGYLEFTVNLLNKSLRAPNVQSVKDQLVLALRAEIDVLAYQSQYPTPADKTAWLVSDESIRLMDKSLELRAAASSALDRLMSRI